MRTTAFILAFIVLALSLLPCADRSNVTKAGEAKTELVSESKHTDNQGVDDLCPPFCHCGCCASVFMKACFLSLDARSLTYADKISSHVPGDITGISLPIWQPPQLVA